MFETKFNKNNTLFKNLLTIKGIGNTKAILICKYIGINKNIKIKDIPNNYLEKLYFFLTSIKKQSFNDISNKNMGLNSNNETEISKLFTKNKEKINKNFIKLNNLNLNIKNLDKKRIKNENNNTYYNKENNLFIFNLLSSHNLSLYISPSDERKHKLNKINITNNFTIIEDNLLEYNKSKILKLININTYRGRCLKFGYPNRGQRTRSNARTARKKITLKITN